MLSEQQQRIMGYFIEEAKDHLNTIEQGLLNLQATIEDPEMVHELFRAAHSVKGGAAMLGLTSIQHTAHRLEDYFKVLKECSITIDQKLESLLLRVYDTLSELVEHLQGPFGLTDDKAEAAMAEVEPVFTELNQHLSQLVDQSGSRPPEDISLTAPASAQPAVNAAPIEQTPTEESVLRFIFQNDIPAQLREMLQLFKQADTSSTRQHLQALCQAMAQPGEQLDLPAWCELLEQAEQAIANPENTYRTLAPVVIKDIKRAQEQIVTGVTTVAASADLLNLIPAAQMTDVGQVASDLPDLLEPLDANQTAQSATSDAAEQFDSTFSSLFSSSLELSPNDAVAPTLDATLDSTDYSTLEEGELFELSFDQSNQFDHTLPALSEHQFGPEVGMTELNSLADLFEHEHSDLGLDWQAGDETGGTSESLELDAASDFSDLLFQDSSDELILDETEDLSDLLNNVQQTPSAAQQHTRANSSLNEATSGITGSSELADLPFSLDQAHPNSPAQPPSEKSEETDLFLTELLDSSSMTTEAASSLQNLDELLLELGNLDDFTIATVPSANSADVAFTEAPPDFLASADEFELPDQSNADAAEFIEPNLAAFELNELELTDLTDLTDLPDLASESPQSIEPKYETEHSQQQADTDLWNAEELLINPLDAESLENPFADLSNKTALSQLSPRIEHPPDFNWSISSSDQSEQFTLEDELDADELDQGLGSSTINPAADVLNSDSFSFDASENAGLNILTDSELNGFAPLELELSADEAADLDFNFAADSSELDLNTEYLDLDSEALDDNLESSNSKFTFEEFGVTVDPFNLPSTPADHAEPAESDLPVDLDLFTGAALAGNYLTDSEQDHELTEADNRTPEATIEPAAEADHLEEQADTNAPVAAPDITSDVVSGDFFGSELPELSFDDQNPFADTTLEAELFETASGSPFEQDSELDLDLFNEPGSDLGLPSADSAISEFNLAGEEPAPRESFDFGLEQSATDHQPAQSYELFADLTEHDADFDLGLADLAIPESNEAEAALDDFELLNLDFAESGTESENELLAGDNQAAADLTLDKDDLEAWMNLEGPLPSLEEAVEPDEVGFDLADLDQFVHPDLTFSQSATAELAEFDQFAETTSMPLNLMQSSSEHREEEYQEEHLALHGESTEDLSNLENWLQARDSAEITVAEPDGFADLDVLLIEESLPTAAVPAAEASNDFADLEMLLDDAPAALEISTPQKSELEKPEIAAPSPQEDEFSDLEALLQDADQTLGAGSMPTRRTSTVANRRTNRRSGLNEQTMRVTVKHLDNLNNLVGEMVVNRNSLEQAEERLRQFLDNLLHQVQQLSDVGQRMRDLYERSLLESSLLSGRRGQPMTLSNGSSSSQANHATGANFDALEMDRFTGFHTLSQEMIELIVRVRESASDIDFVVEETDQVTRNFRQITTQLQEGLTRSRMVPFAQMADRLPRGVRDNSLKYGKQAELVIEGRDTLIDKMIVELLYDPMTHLVNNAVAHGIETPEERIAAGKSPTGRITIRAFHQGNQTVIAISDDGAGINPEAVRAKALAKGLIDATQARDMSRLDTYDLLFHHGFSTVDQVDDLRGRGVGLDVVRSNLNEIRGTINIDSAVGKGTTFTIRLPLTLSISKALCCISNRARIAFPMDGVEDMLDTSKERIQIDEQGRQCIQWRDTLLPFQALSELLHHNRMLGRGSVYGGNQEEDILSIVVLRSAGNFLALQVDQVLGEQEIVIKQLEGPVPKPLGIAGATVLGDGRIMPIADVLELIDLSQGRIRRESGSLLWDQGEAQLPPEPTTKTEPTVLIVDDSITVRELLSMTFNKVGYRVEQARDGQEAWEKLRSGLPCDLVFCDIEMPRMDGLELLSRLQQDPNLSHLPIAMLTSRGADRHRQMAIQLGAKGYFTKPYLEEVLLDAAQRMLKGEVMVIGTNLQ
jgi:chemosensory pili system protein ChpA (sensor histidine kinase/response regulator)